VWRANADGAMRVGLHRAAGLTEAAGPPVSGAVSTTTCGMAA